MKMSLISSLMSLVSLASLSAQANVSNMVGTWHGSGAVFSLGGAPEGEYTVRLDDTLQADGSVASSVTVTASGTPDKHFDQILRDTQGGFSIQSPLGSGEATCVGEGLCEGYLGDATGNGTAITTVRDDADHIRILKTELRSFHPTRFYREQYVRTAK